MSIGAAAGSNQTPPRESLRAAVEALLHDVSITAM
jgi:hypothetical protein